MNKWAELRTTFQVAKLGTVSAAATSLGLHRATVNRHVDLLETELGARIFLRHARGYTLTELGEDVLRTAQKTDELIEDLAGRARVDKAPIEGEIKIATLAPFAPLLMEPVSQFRVEHPNCQVIVSATDDLVRLEHGDAHIALRAGVKPDYPEYVVQTFRDIRFSLYAHDSYIARHGRPSGIDDLDAHQFIVPQATDRDPLFRRWIDEHVHSRQVALRTSHPQITSEAIYSGLGLGFLSDLDAGSRSDLHEIVPSNKAWTVAVWLVTHVDLHRTGKVQAMLDCLKAAHS